MKKCSLLIIVFCSQFILQCKILKNEEDCTRIFNSINSETFQIYFKLCANTDELKIWDATNRFEKCTVSLSECKKVIKIKKIDFEYDINNIKKNFPYKGLILYQYEITNNSYTLCFIEIETNAFLILKFDSKSQKLLDVSNGVL